MPQHLAARGGLPKGRDTSGCGNGKDFIHGEGGIFKALWELRQDHGQGRRKFQVEGSQVE